jgi:hypothetical protein
VNLYTPLGTGEKPVATAVAVLNGFGTDNWNAELYESLSLAARLSMAVKAVKNHGQIVKMSYLLWKINGHVGSFFQEVEDIVAGTSERTSTSATTADEPVTPERIQKSIDSFMEIGKSFSRIYEEAQRKRLLNNSLIAGPIIALRANSDRFFEMAEWFDLLLNTERVEEIFADANAQRSKGEVYDLSQV